MSQPFEIVIDPEVEARRKERAIEYGTWECAEAPITVGGARAFNEGDPVPKSTVDRLGLDALGAVVPAGVFAKKTAEAEVARVAAQDEAVKAQIEAVAAMGKPPRARRSTTSDETGGNG
jgi:hypothetical protein